MAIRHYNVTDMFWLNIDDFMFGSMPSTPTFAGLPATIDFDQVPVGIDADLNITVTAYSLTNDITATTTAPFSVSADGVTYGTTATLTAATGITTAPLYIRYSPTTIGTDNATLTLASTGATSVTASLTGTGIDCAVSTYPYNFSFDDASQLNCWGVIDGNGDGSTFSANLTSGYAYYTYNSANAADDYLISPEFVLTGNELASFDYWCASSGFPETFVVYAWGTDTVLLVNTVTVTNTSSAPLTQYVDLSTLNGNYRLVIKCISMADQYRLYVDNFSVANAATSLTISTDAMDFGTIPTGTTSVATADLTIVNATDPVVVTTAAPYAVSLDGTTFATTVTIPAPATTVANQTIYVQFAPTAAGTFDGSVAISTTGANKTITLAGMAIVCDVITTFPFIENFEPTSPTRTCWSFEDANNDGSTFQFMAYDDVNLGVAVYFYNASSAANDWLISPEMTLPADAHVGYNYACAGASYPEQYSVWIIPQGGTTASAVNVLPTQTVTNSNAATNSVDISAYAGQTVRIAFKVESAADMYYLYFDDFAVTEGVGINDVENNVSIYPNPATEVLNVNANSNIQSVEVLNIMGQTIQSYSANDNNTQINISNLANGVYMVKINTENGVVNQKFTVAR